MIPSITKPVRQRPVPTEEVQPWVNMELLPFLRQVRQYANYVNRVEATLVTAATALVTTIWTSADIAVDTAFRIDCSVVAWASNDRAFFTLSGLFYNDGTFQQSGADVVGPTVNGAGYSVNFLVVANHLELQVQDAGAVPVSWVAVIDTTEAP